MSSSTPARATLRVIAGNHSQYSPARRGRDPCGPRPGGKPGEAVRPGGATERLAGSGPAGGVLGEDDEPARVRLGDSLAAQLTDDGRGVLPGCQQIAGLLPELRQLLVAAVHRDVGKLPLHRGDE